VHVVVDEDELVASHDQISQRASAMTWSGV
jgi:hypothetical protein